MKVLFGALVAVIVLSLLVMLLNDPNDKPVNPVDPIKPDDVKPGPSPDPTPDPTPTPVEDIVTVQVKQINKVFAEQPNFSQYQFQAKEGVAEGIWNNEYFGGRVYDPVYKNMTMQDGSKNKVAVPNNLNNDFQAVK